MHPKSIILFKYIFLIKILLTKRLYMNPLSNPLSNFLMEILLTKWLYSKSLLIYREFHMYGALKTFFLIQYEMS